MAELLVTLGGALSIAALAWFFFGSRERRAEAELRGGRQEVEIIVKGGYSPNLIRARAGSSAAARLRPPGGRRLHRPGRLPRPRREPLARPVRAHGRSSSRPIERRVRLRLRHEHGPWHARSSSPTATAATAAATAPGANGASTVDDVAEAVGVGPRREVSEPTETVLALQPGGISCASCVSTIEAALLALPGVDRAARQHGNRAGHGRLRPRAGRRRAAAAGDRRRRLRAAGGRRPSAEDGGDAEAAARRAEIADLSRRVLLGAVLTAPVLFAVMAADVFGASWVPDSCSTAGCSWR